MGTLNKKDYTYVRAAGDGACLFNSVSQNIHLDENIREGVDDKKYTFKLTNKAIEPISLSLRNDAVDWLKDNLSEITPMGLSYEQSILDEIEEGDLQSSVKDIDSYLNYMKEVLV